MNTTTNSKKGWQTCACGCGRSFRVNSNQTTGRRRTYFDSGCRTKVARANARAAFHVPAAVPTAALVVAANDQRSARGETPAPGANGTNGVHVGRPVQVNTHTTGSNRNSGRIVRSMAHTAIYIAEESLRAEGGK